MRRMGFLSGGLIYERELFHRVVHLQDIKEASSAKVFDIDRKEKGFCGATNLGFIKGSCDRFWA
jgi:hypothetical protein